MVTPVMQGWPGARLPASPCPQLVWEGGRLAGGKHSHKVQLCQQHCTHTCNYVYFNIAKLCERGIELDKQNAVTTLITCIFNQI